MVIFFIGYPILNEDKVRKVRVAGTADTSLLNRLPLPGHDFVPALPCRFRGEQGGPQEAEPRAAAAAGPAGRLRLRLEQRGR